MTGAVSRIVLARPLILIVSWCGIASSTMFRASVAAIIICQNIAQQSSRRCATHCEQGVALGQYRASSGAQSSTQKRVVFFAAVCGASSHGKHDSADGCAADQRSGEFHGNAPIA